MNGGNEREAGIRRHTTVTVESHGGLSLFSIAADVALFYHTALGLARRTAGVYQQGQSLSPHLSLTGDSLLANGSRQFVGIENGYASTINHQPSTINHQPAPSQHFAVGYQQFGTAVAHHEVQSFGRIGRIQRHIGTACRQYAQRSNSHPLVAGNQNPHHIPLGESVSYDFLRNTTGQCHHVTIGVAYMIINHCDILRRHSGLMPY